MPPSSFVSKGSRALRRVPGTQEEKARRVGRDRSTISLWERDERSPRRGMRELMFRAWGIAKSWWDEPYNPAEGLAFEPIQTQTLEPVELQAAA